MLAIALEFRTVLDASIAPGCGALRLEGTGGTMVAFIISSLGEVTVGGFVGSGFAIGQGVLCGTGKLILVQVIREVG